MSHELSPAISLESLRKQAKRWLKALRELDPEAWLRLKRACPEAPAAPTLRDVQHALAREQGLQGWTQLKLAAAQQRPAPTDQDDLRQLVARGSPAPPSTR